MSKIKQFFVNLNKKIKKSFAKIKNSINNFLEKIDKKVKPKTGYFWYRFFKIFSRILFMVIFPTIIILVGVDAYNVVLNDSEIHKVAIIVCGVLYIVFQFIAIFMKKYFAKWRHYSPTKKIKANSVEQEKAKSDSEIEKKQVEKKIN